MRKRIELQYELGTIRVEDVKIPKTRDELPPTLRALQYIYQTPEANEQVFTILNKKILTTHKGRPGMSLWEILVLGIVRLTLDVNYDRLEHIANYDRLVRSILGIENEYGFTARKTYSLQAIKDNVSLLDEDMLDEINNIVISQGHKIKKKENEKISAKVDSYVVESNVHFPTDLNLLKDGINKSIKLCTKLADILHLSGWRKQDMWLNRIKSQYRIVNKIKGGKNQDSRKKRAVLNYLDEVVKVLDKIDKSKQEFEQLDNVSTVEALIYKDLLYFEEMSYKHVNLIRRRLLLDEVIPHSEKVFSLFEVYTEWINKGKAGNKIELGIKLAISTDQFGFILNKRIMENEQDVDAAVPIFEALKAHYDMESISYDKGFWSKENYESINGEIPQVIMPKKGKQNKEEYEREHTKEFIKKRKAHSAIESNINSLEHHGLNRCPDKGLGHYKRYIALGVLSYNLHKLGNILQEEELKKAKRRNKKKLAA